MSSEHTSASSPGRPSRALAWAWRIACGAALALALWNAGLFADRARLAGWPYPLDHEEDYLLVHAWRLARGESYVQPLGEPPFIVGTYNPLFPLMAAAFTDPDAPELFPGRALAVGSAVLAALALSLLAGRLSRSWLFGLCAGAAWLLSRDALRWTPLYRVDFLALALGWLALAPMAFADRLRKPWLAFLASGTLAVAAYFAKQTAATAGLAIFLALLAWKPKAALKWGAGSGGAVLGLSLLCEALSPGSFFFHTIAANANEFSAWQLGVWARHFWLFQKVLLAGTALAGLLAAGAWVAKGRPAFVRRPETLAEAGTLALWLYAGVGMAFFAGSGKLGAAENYMLEPLACLLLALAAIAGRLRGLEGRSAWLALAAPAVLVAHLAFSLTPLGSLPGLSAPRALLGVPPPRLEDIRAAAAVEKAIARDPKGVFCDRASLALRHGAPLVMHPFICAQLAREGKWDDRLALDHLEKLRPRLMILSEDLRPGPALPADAQYTERFRDWLLARYVLREERRGFLFSYYFWEQKP